MCDIGVTYDSFISNVKKDRQYFAKRLSDMIDYFTSDS